MSLETFRAALGSKLGEIVTPELAAWLEENAFDRVSKAYIPATFDVGRYGKYVFSVEAFNANELHPLHEAHWAETEGHKTKAMKPDYAGFANIERAGGLIQFVMRLDGKLVGHVRMYLYRSMHTQERESKEDVFFVLKEHRSGFLAIRFWQYVERCLKQVGVANIYTDSKLVNRVGKLNEYLGYKKIAEVYYKSLE